MPFSAVKFKSVFGQMFLKNVNLTQNFPSPGGLYGLPLGN